MSYIVPMKMPKYCNKCPFGACQYSYPLGSSSISEIDGEKNEPYTHGYVCNIDWWQNGQHTKIMRAHMGDNISIPEWCGLKESEQK